ncbi:MAG: hypothetical protein ND866_24525, partial [Pyrinomonadaceae bacterium]|nr:hypothetical protein [Pyrinomonadaceae bacterium]
MTDTLRKLRINSNRMLAAFNELARIGATGDGGVNRPSLSEAHLAARQWFREQIEKSGLEFRTDGAGNRSAVLALPTLAPGAHLPRAQVPWSAGEGIGTIVSGAVGAVEAQVKESFPNESEITSPSFDYAAYEQRLRSGRLAMTPTLLLGSHLDSVPNGGRFDGALGVMAA